MRAIDSPYYPSRAGWLGRRVNGWHRLRRRLEIALIPAHEPPSRRRFLAWVLVPGLVYLHRARDAYGLACGVLVLVIWFSVTTVYWIQIGQPDSWLALVILATIHSLCFVAALNEAAPEADRTRRILRAAIGGPAVAVGFTILYPAVIARLFVVPLERGFEPILIHPWHSPGGLRRGDWVGYRIYGGQLSFDRILALPEETVHFREDAFEVGGTAFRRVSDRMPKAGEVDVPKGAYYIWPVAVRYGHGGGDQTEGLSSLAVVGQGDVIGAAYRRWFWRSYELEPLVELKR